MEGRAAAAPRGPRAPALCLLAALALRFVRGQRRGWGAAGPGRARAPGMPGRREPAVPGLSPGRRGAREPSPGDLPRGCLHPHHPAPLSDQHSGQATPHSLPPARLCPGCPGPALAPCSASELHPVAASLSPHINPPRGRELPLCRDLGGG